MYTSQISHEGKYHISPDVLIIECVLILSRNVNMMIFALTL